MPIATVIALIMQYGPLAAKLAGVLIDDAPIAQKLITDLANQFAKNGDDPESAIAKAFSMHLVPPTQWTADELKAWYAKADGVA